MKRKWWIAVVALTVLVGLAIDQGNKVATYASYQLKYISEAGLAEYANLRLEPLAIPQPSTSPTTLEEILPSWWIELPEGKQIVRENSSQDVPSIRLDSGIELYFMVLEVRDSPYIISEVMVVDAELAHALASTMPIPLNSALFTSRSDLKANRQDILRKIHLTKDAESIAWHEKEQAIGLVSTMVEDAYLDEIWTYIWPRSGEQRMLFVRTLAPHKSLSPAELEEPLSLITSLRFHDGRSSEETP